MNDCIKVRCNSCAAVNEIYVRDFYGVMLIEVYDKPHYELQPGEDFGCGHCGRRHKHRDGQSLMIEVVEMPR